MASIAKQSGLPRTKRTSELKSEVQNWNLRFKDLLRLFRFGLIQGYNQYHAGRGERNGEGPRREKTDSIRTSPSLTQARNRLTSRPLVTLRTRRRHHIREHRFQSADPTNAMRTTILCLSAIAALAPAQVCLPSFSSPQCTK
jgi:hypothetical protein